MIAQGDPIVVVHAVMRPDLDRQWILVEQTLTGSPSDESAHGVIPGNPPQLPVTGATVTVANLSLANDPCGAVSFTENPSALQLPRADGLYWGPQNCPTMRTGDTLELLVETTDGHAVKGRTELPGAAAMILLVGSDSVLLPGPPLRLNRDSDTLGARVVAVAGRALQLEVSGFDSAGGSALITRFLVDTTAITLPGNLTDFLAGVLGEEDSTSVDELEPILVAGRSYTATIALTDERYFDYLRSGNLPLSGRGFINHLEGGMGVFGSIVARTNMLKVVGDIDDEREGTYRLVGSISGRPVDVTLELYVAAAGEDSTAASSFVVGQWFLGGIDNSARGFFRGDTLALTIYQPALGLPDSVSAFVVGGLIGVTGSFELDVYDADLSVVGSLTATRGSPPGLPRVIRGFQTGVDASGFSRAFGSSILCRVSNRSAKSSLSSRSSSRPATWAIWSDDCSQRSSNSARRCSRAGCSAGWRIRRMGPFPQMSSFTPKATPSMVAKTTAGSSRSAM